MMGDYIHGVDQSSGPLGLLHINFCPFHTIMKSKSSEGKDTYINHLNSHFFEDIVRELIERYPQLLNTKQMQSLISCLQYALAYIQGPPATGKTHAAAVVAYFLNKH